MTESTIKKTSWPVFRSLASFRPSDLPGDLIAGLTLAAIAIPEQMATARLGGFSPQIGFFAFIAGSLGFAMLGGNRFLSCGADSTITPIFAGGLLLMATSGSPDYQALAIALALLVGVILVVGSLFRLGWIANLLSTPVTVGFLAGISVHILVSQMPGVLGLPSPKGPTLDKIAVLAQHLGESNFYTLCIGFGVFAIVAGSEKISAKIPGALIGLIGATAAVILGHLESKGVSVVGAVPGTLPTPSFPNLAPERWVKLLPLAFLIAIVVMVQTAATTRSFLSDPDKPADVDRDFLGAGAGGVLLFGALRIIRVGQIVAIYRQSFGEFLLIVATAAAIIALPIEQGVAVGIALSLLHGIWSTTRARLVQFERVPDTTIWWPANPHMP